MNIIEIIWHDLGRHLGCYGVEQVKSPNLDKLASEGIIFENCYCSSPLCSPSRGSIMTGRYPHNNGLIGLTHRGWEFNKDERFLPQLLNSSGYQTALFGFQHEVTHGEGKILGYEVSLEGHSDAVDVAGDPKYEPDVASWFNQWVKHERDIDKPFFATVGLRWVHRPHMLGEYTEEDLKKVKIPAYLPDTMEIRRDIAAYQGLIERADSIVGDILKAVDSAGIKDDTIILFTTDHGSDYPRAKSTLYDPGIGVALIMRVPGAPVELKNVKSLISNVDFLPTMLESAGVSIPDNIQGKSFWPMLSGKEYRKREEIFAERTWQGTYDPIRCIRTDKYKLIRNFLPGWPPLVCPEFVKNVGTEVLERHFGYARPEYELYDMIQDPDENNNLAGQADYIDIEKDLKERLSKFLEDSGDPIINGVIPHPGRHNDVWHWKQIGGKWKLYDMKNA